MMTDEILTFMRIALASALAAVLIAGGRPRAGAQDSDHTEGIEAREDAASEELFTPPLSGAPKQRVGAASRELGAARPPCGEEGEDAADAEGEGVDCANGEPTLAAPESGEEGETSQ